MFSTGIYTIENKESYLASGEVKYLIHFFDLERYKGKLTPGMTVRGEIQEYHLETIRSCKYDFQGLVYPGTLKLCT